MHDWTTELPVRQGVVLCGRVSIPGSGDNFDRASHPEAVLVGRTLVGPGAFPRSGLAATRPASRDFSSLAGRFEQRLFKREVVVKDDASSWMEKAAGLESSGAAARSKGDERAAEAHFREGLGLALKAANRGAENPSDPHRVAALHLATRLALSVGEVSEARRMMAEAFEIDSAFAHRDEWEQLRDAAAWPDAWLVAAVRGEAPDTCALDALAERFWKPLFSRCYLLTVDHDKAGDLAQQAWCRVLRARQRLSPAGNFPGYLTTVATNLWRDSHRSARRAGPMSEDRLASLDQSLSLEDGENIVLADLLPDSNSLQGREQTLLKLDIDRALGQLTPHLREVLVARYITGESCAEIGSRYGRTEQTVSGWVREAIREMQLHLEEPATRTVQTNEP